MKQAGADQVKESTRIRNQVQPSCTSPFPPGVSGIDLLLSGRAFSSSSVTPEVVPHKSALEILTSREEGVKCNFQGVLLVCEDFPRDVQYTESSPHKRRTTLSAEGKIADVILVDRTGPVATCLWNDVAEEICSIWREHQKAGKTLPCVVELSKVRITGLARNAWNGESIARLKTLKYIQHISNDSGTTVRALDMATADNLTNKTFTVPPTDWCVSVFRTLRTKCNTPFRLTVKGKVVDLQPLETTQSGHPKRVFDLVDNAGMYFTCCAMKHNADSTALQNFQEVVVYYGTGRGPIGISKGMLYLLQDACIIPVGSPSLLNTEKLEELTIR